MAFVFASVALAAPRAAAQTISSAANQTFVVGDAATSISAITVTDATAQITAGNDIRILIPAAFNMIWNTAITTATITGTGAAKVSTTVTYEDASKTLVLNVTANFTSGQAITVSGLQFTNFTATSAVNHLGVNAQGAGNGATASDPKNILIVAPTFTSAANQTFVVGDPSTAMTTMTVTDNATAPSITAANDIRIRIPAGFNMTWNTALTTATIGGGAAGKVSTTVSYENAGQVLVLNVTSNFAASDQITVSGLQFTSFTAASAAAGLQLVVSGSAGGGTAATNSSTKQIVQPTISSAANQTFVVAQIATGISTITVTDNATLATITAANDIRIRIPASLNMTWNTALTTATIGGGAAAKVSTTVSYEDAGKTLVLNVTSNFVTSNQITVAGLQFANFTAASAATNLELVVSGTGGGTAAADNRTITIAAPTIASAANQTFVVAQAATAISTITVTDGASPAITTANDIRIRIPASLNMTWNTALTTATIGGGAAAKVSTTVTYEDAGKTLVLNVTSAFVAGNQITVSGLQFTSFTAVSAADQLQLVVGGAGGTTNALDSRTITIVAPTLAGAANQVFTVGDAATAMTSVTITDASTATITAANDLRIRIPAGFNMTWNTALTTATIGGAAAAKVSTTVSYENSGQVLVLNVTSNFAAADQITVSGLQFTSFTAVSAADNLQLVVSGSAGGGTVATSSTTKQIVAPTFTGAANQVFTVSDAATAMTGVTITDASIGTITAANDLRIRIPAGFNMTWNTALTTATIGGAAAAKVSTTVSYENSGQVLVLNVTSNFAAADQITVSGLQFTSFTAVSAANNLQLVVSGSAGGGTAATSSTTKQIVQPTFTGAANQMFTVGDAATAMTSVTITDASTATITAANDLRIRIPAGFNMTWNTALTTATIGGGAAAKVSTTVSYENSGQVLVLNVTSNFAAGDQITVSGLQFASFTAVSAANNLQLVVSGSAGGGTAASSSTTKQIVQPVLSSAANKTFAVGDPATTMSMATVTDNATAAGITAANDIRIRIPTGFNMTWNTGLTTATIGGAAAAKVSTTVSYENSGQVLVLNVTSNFAAGDQITVSGLQFTSFSAASPVNNLQLVVSGAGGGTAANDDKTIIILTIGVGVSPHATAASRLPSNGTTYTIAFAVQNTGAVTDSFDLLVARQPGTTLTTVSIVGTGITQGGNPDSARLHNVSAGASFTATVTYSVASVIAGTQDTLSLTARSITTPTQSDRGRLTVTAVRPNMTLSKAVVPSGTQAPGTDLTYTATITNNGTSNATTLVVVDTLPTTVQFKVGSESHSLPAGVTVIVEYSNNGGSTWTYAPASGACSAPATYDRCVNRVRWTLQNPLSFTGPNNSGTLQLIARIR